MLKSPRKLLVASVAALLLAAACGGDDSETATGAAGGTTAGGGAAAGSLAGVCPEKLVIQTDWNPEAEHGGIYQMVGDNPTIDASKKIVTGPLVAGGNDTGIDIEIRTGGPAIAFESPTSQMYKDKTIHMGYVYTDEAIQNAVDKPTVSVFAGLDINPQIIMWDPVTYPNVKKIADLKAAKATVRYFESAAYMEYFRQTGILDEAQLDSGYDGTPALFTSQQGKIAQQGFASAEPYIYKNEVENWGKDVAFQLVHDAGWQPYSGPLAVRKADLAGLKGCLEKFVPIAQQAQVDFIKAPDETNKLILDLVEQYDTGWIYTDGVAKFSVEQMVKLGLVGNGTNQTIGDHDEARVADLIKKALPVYESSGEVNKDLKPADIVTNEFIDESIKL
ncbi:MAG: ABC transporter substrate-binding protein [Acidimicrobiales bacterium]